MNYLFRVIIFHTVMFLIVYSLFHDTLSLNWYIPNFGWQNYLSEIEGNWYAFDWVRTALNWLILFFNAIINFFVNVIEIFKLLGNVIINVFNIFMWYVNSMGITGWIIVIISIGLIVNDIFKAIGK